MYGRYLLLARFALLVLAFIALHAQAAVPNTLNYQGQLNTAIGVPVNATVSITFKLYAAATGGSALWSEAQNIAVVNGQYSAMLGQTVPLPSTLFDAPLYLGIAVASDAEMTPRVALSSTPYALKANDTQTVGGFTVAQLRTIPWVDVTGSSQQAVSNTGYLVDNPVLSTILLPAAPAIGDFVAVTGAGVGVWTIVKSVGQSVITMNISGGIALSETISGGQGDAITLQYIGNNKYTVLNYAGNLNLVAAAAPTASAVSISGVSVVGQTLTGSYTYADPNYHPEGVSTFRWLRNGYAIAGATSTRYQLVAADVGAAIRFEVTPISSMAPLIGMAVLSNATSTVMALPAGYVIQGGLMWMPVSSTTYYNWTQASALCAGTINGQTGWRLPTQTELSALYTSGAMNGQGWTLSNTWSSAPIGSGSHYGVYLNNGIVYLNSDTGNGYVSCVH